MATVPYRLESHEDFDDQDSFYQDPLALVDAPYSDAARAEADSESFAIEDISQTQDRCPKKLTEDTKSNFIKYLRCVNGRVLPYATSLGDSV
jgi:hypothetical protein